MHSLEGILKLADNELMSMAENGKFRSREDVDTAYKLVDIAKDVYCIWKYEDDEGYSEASYEGYEGSYRGGRSNRGSYESRRSYERGGGRSRESRRGSRNSYRGYSRDSKQEFMEEMREMMEDAPDDQTRQSIQRMISQMEQM